MNVDAETDAADREVEEINGVASENGREENARVDEAEIEQANRTDKEKSEERVNDADSPAEAVTDRAELFAKGLAFERNGKPDYALQCYVNCLKDLRGGSTFTKLPQCLHRIADIYFEDNQYEKALQFIQAEKLYYEKALIDLGDLLATSGSANDNDDNQVDEPATSDSPLAQKADEYERLARLCLDEGTPHLALEYCGKATKIRQSVFGDHHATTVQSLELFTTIYAQVGKMEYSDAMKKYTRTHNDNDDGVDRDSQDRDEKEASSQKDETLIEEKPVEPQPDDSDATTEKKKEELSGSDSEKLVLSQTSVVRLLLIYFVVTVFLSITVTLLWCDYGQSTACPSSRFLMQRARFYIKAFASRIFS
ncbi:uncharacterized protein [Oscarella lobularis]|uniref:uncharacterized protein isoform X2 n=1 Tax=Oscarella lobularis TaxID=121494 RepID=UPI003313DA1E